MATVTLPQRPADKHKHVNVTSLNTMITWPVNECPAVCSRTAGSVRQTHRTHFWDWAAHLVIPYFSARMR